MAVPVHVIAGFLGAGKTTTLLHLLASRPGERVAVVVNDFGEARIDDAVLAEHGPVRITAIEGGCVCCTAPENFVGAMAALLHDVRPDRIFVEPTGLARPADLVDTLRRAPFREEIDVRPLIVLVDPEQLDGELVAEHVEAADVLVANRVDLASSRAIDRFRALARGRWPSPLRVVETTFGQLPDGILDVVAVARDVGHDHDHPSTDGYAATSWTWPSDVVFAHDRLLAAVGAAAGGVARLKGLFRTEEGVALVEVAGGRVHERPSAYRADSRVDVIAQGQVPPNLRATLDAAVLTDEERRLDGGAIEIVLPDGRRPRFDRAALAALPDGIPDVSVLVPKRQGAAARLARLFERAGVRGDASVVVVATDGLATSPVPASALSTAILVHSLGDGPLPGEQGGPFRLLVPGDAGPAGPCSNVKGVARIVVR